MKPEPHAWPGRHHCEFVIRKPGKDDRRCPNGAIYHMRDKWLCGTHRNMFVRGRGPGK